MCDDLAVAAALASALLPFLPPRPQRLRGAKTCQTKLYKRGALHYIKLKIGKLKANRLPKIA